MSVVGAPDGHNGGYSSSESNTCAFGHGEEQVDQKNSKDTKKEDLNMAYQMPHRSANPKLLDLDRFTMPRGGLFSMVISSNWLCPPKLTCHPKVAIWSIRPASMEVDWPNP